MIEIILNLLYIIIPCIVCFLIGYRTGKYAGWQEGIVDEYEFQCNKKNKIHKTIGTCNCPTCKIERLEAENKEVRRILKELWEHPDSTSEWKIKQVIDEDE